MRMNNKALTLILAILLSGCSIPCWVPFLGSSQDQKVDDTKVESSSILQEEKIPGYCFQEFADQLYSKAIKSCAGIDDAEAYYDMAYMYSHGLGTPVNYYASCYLMEKAAQKEHVEAMYELALMYDRGVGCRQDYKIAFKWYEKSAKKGLPKSMNALASLYYCGDGIKQDPKTALFWYYKSAQHQNSYGMYNVASLLEEGVKSSEVLPQDPIFWYKKAANAGDPEAKFYLLKREIKGKLSSSDVAKIKNVADQGSIQASIYLGDFYRSLNKKNVSFCWYYKATLKGSSSALNSLKSLTDGWSDRKFEQVKSDCEK